MLSLGGIFDVDRKERRLEEVNREMENPDLWNDPEHAQKISKEKKTLEDLCGSFKRLTSGIADAKELFEMSLADNDEAGAETVAAEVEGFEKDVEKLEFKRMFNQPMDSANCYLEIQAGAGGTEAQDWASMLERMYLRYAERSGFSAKLTEETEGDVAGIKGCTIFIEGEWAYGTLRTETGIHRLVRKSPFDANARRQTSFASLEVMPELDNTIQVDIRPEDIEMQVYRSSGAGGQHINKTSSAVRLIHKPTGVVVSCQTQRSQFQNRDYAMEMLKAKLYQIAKQQHMDKIDDIKGVQNEIAWGHQIRSYVFMPYTMVKDHRTNYETGNVDAVMDGDLDGFIFAYLKAASRGELQDT